MRTAFFHPRSFLLPALLALIFAAMPVLPGRSAAEDDPILEAVRLIDPDAKRTADGSILTHRLPKHRHIDGKDAYVDIPNPMKVLDVAERWFLSGMMQRRALFIRIDADATGALGMALLAVVPIGQPTDAPFDLVDVASDRFTALETDPRPSLGIGDDLLLVRNSHGNSNQSYHDELLLRSVDGRLEKVVSIAMIDVSTCAYRTKQTARYESAAPAGKGPGALAVTVTETVSKASDDCDDAAPLPKGASWQTVLEWDEATHGFRARTDALERLEEHNEGLR